MIGGSGSDSGSDSDTDFASSASAGSIALSLPGRLGTASETPRLPGVRFSDPMTLAPEGEAGRTLTDRDDDDGGRDASAARACSGAFPSEPEGEPVRLGELEALPLRGPAPARRRRTG